MASGTLRWQWESGNEELTTAVTGAIARHLIRHVPLTSAEKHLHTDIELEPAHSDSGGQDKLTFSKDGFICYSYMSMVCQVHNPSTKIGGDKIVEITLP